MFDNVLNDDAALSQEVSQRVGMSLPAECVAGVAANARLIQQHLDALRGAVRDRD